MALGKDFFIFLKFLCRVPGPGTRQRIFYFFFNFFAGCPNLAPGKEFA
jgi:hypothetical protein